MSKLSDLSVNQTIKFKKEIQNIEKNLLNSNLNLKNLLEPKYENFDISFPFNDFIISSILNSFLFPHPQLLLSFIVNESKLDDYDLSCILKPLFLYSNDINPINLIEIFSKNFLLTKDELFLKFSYDFQSLKCKEEWNKLFPNIEYDESSFFFKDLNLISMNDIFSIHNFCVTFNLKIYFLKNLNDNNNNFLFSTCLGSTNSKSNLFIYCHSNKLFFNLLPLNYLKNYKIKKNNYLFNLIKLPFQKEIIYFNFFSLFKIINNLNFNDFKFELEFKNDFN